MGRALMGQKLHWVDAETTGLIAGVHEIIQLSGIIEHDGEVVEEYDIFMRPAKPDGIDPQALVGQGRTVAEIMKWPDRKAGFEELIEILERYRIKVPLERHRWVGQNPMFDVNFVRALFLEFKSKAFNDYWSPLAPIDLIPVAKEARRKGMYKGENHKLPTICRELGIEYSAHDSLEDIRATRMAMYKFDEMFKTPIHRKRQLPLL